MKARLTAFNTIILEDGKDVVGMLSLTAKVIHMLKQSNICIYLNEHIISYAYLESMLR